MRKFLIYLLFIPKLMFIPITAVAEQFDFFNSIDEVIAYETEQILTIAPYEYASLSDAYVSRGESFLLAGKYNPALVDLLKGYDFASFCEEDEAPSLMIRALFGLALVYGNLDMFNEMNASCDAMIETLDYFGHKKMSEKRART